MLVSARVLVSVSLEEGVKEVSWQDELLCTGWCSGIWRPLFPWDQKALASLLHLRWVLEGLEKQQSTTLFINFETNIKIFTLLLCI